MSLLKEESLAKKLLTKGSIAYIFTFIIAPTGYLIRILVSNTLSVADIGIFYSVLGLVNLLAAYNDLGLTEALQYFLPKYWIEKKYDHYKTIRIYTLVIQLLSGIIIGGGLWLGADWLSNHYFHAEQAVHILKILSIYFVIVNFLQVLSSVYTAFQDILFERVIETIRLYSILIFTFIFRVTQSLSLETFSYVQIGGLGIVLAISIFLFMVKYAKTLRLGSFVRDVSIIKKQFRYAFWTFLGTNAGLLLGQVDQQIIIVLMGPQAAGYYTNYLSLFGLYNVFAYPIMGLLFPLTIELITKKHVHKLELLLQILYKYFSLLALSIGGLFVALGPVLAQVLYGEKFIYSGTLLRYAGIFIVLNILIVINFNILAGMGKVKERVMILGVALGANIIANIVFIAVCGWGLLGAIGAMAIGWIIMFWKTLKVIKYDYKFSYDWGIIIRNAIIIIALSYGLWVASTYIDRTTHTAWIVRIAYIGILAVIYYCILVGFNYRSIISLWKELHVLGILKKKHP